MRQLDQRVSARCRLHPLDLPGVAGYVSHRLHRAGGSADRISFSGDAIEAIYERSGGVPRVVNKLCDRALHTAYGRKAAVIDRDTVDAANADHLAVARAPELTARVPSSSAGQLPTRPTTTPPTAMPPLAAPPQTAPQAIAPTLTAPQLTAAQLTAAPLTAPQALAEPVSVESNLSGLDAWITSLDEGPAALPTAGPAPVGPDHDRAVRRTRAETRTQLRIRVGYVAPPASLRAMPTHVPRKWTRRLELLAFSLVLVLVALMLGPAAWDAARDTGTYVAQQFEPPDPPPVPQRPAMMIAPPVISPRAIGLLFEDSSQ
jgi:hypothetical protein